MKTISNWNELEEYGIVYLTSESCGLMWRALFDVTEKGRQIIGTMFGYGGLKLAEAWNGSSSAGKHIGSILLTPEIMPVVAVFALLQSGCIETWKFDTVVYGIEPDDDRDECVRFIVGFHGNKGLRRLAYQGTAGERNQHVMTGRIE